MKKLVGFLFIVLAVYSIYNDLTHGSLPTPVSTNIIEAKTVSQDTTPFFEQEIHPGDTVLSILEQNLDGSLPVSITEAVADFQELNNGTPPEEIIIGNSYKFPNYRQSQ
ncbi:MAG: hypothetical protein ACQEXB_03090 [Bacillota bacterium]